MLRFVIRRRELDRGTGLATESLETVDADCAELERVLRGGGLDPHGAYDHREVAGVELLPDAEPEFTAPMVEAIYAAWHGAGVDIAGGDWKRFVGMLPMA